MTKKQYKEMLNLVIDTYITLVEKDFAYLIKGHKEEYCHMKCKRHWRIARDPINRMNEYIIKRKKDLP